MLIENPVADIYDDFDDELDFEHALKRERPFVDGIEKLNCEPLLAVKFKN